MNIAVFTSQRRYLFAGYGYGLRKAVLGYQLFKHRKTGCEGGECTKENLSTCASTLICFPYAGDKV